MPLWACDQDLDSPIETLLSQKQEKEVSRAHIVETGNLAAARGSSPLLFLLLTEVLYRANFRWITFTATAQVNSLLQRLGMRPDNELAQKTLQMYSAEIDTIVATLEEPLEGSGYA